MAKPKIGVIVGSTRQGRFADHPAKWITELAGARDDIEVELLDLRDYPMPFFDEPASPAYAPSKNEVAQRWQKKIASKDGFIIVTCGIQPRGPGLAQERARLRLYGMEPQAGRLRRLWRRRRRARRRAAPADMHRTADGAGARRGPYPGPGLSRRPEGRQKLSTISSLSCRARTICSTSSSGGRTR